MARTKAGSTNRVANQLTAENGDHAPETTKGKQTIVISAPNMQHVRFRLIGTAPLVIHRFAAKAKMEEAQRAGSTTKKGKKREPKNFEQLYEDAKYKSTDGWLGINAAAFRNASISACRLVGFKMTHAKLAVFTQAMGYDPDGVPLVRISKGEPRMLIASVRNADGSVDLRSRPMWAPGWEAEVTMEFDADQFTATDVTNLMMRVGKQVGICEGRPDSKSSAGMGWGLFRIAGDQD